MTRVTVVQPPGATRLRQLIAAIEALTEGRGYPTTVREVMEATGWSTTSLVSYWLRQARKAGLVAYEDGMARTIRLATAKEGAK